ncbi:MAG: hypothetical protein ACTSRP_02740 [Candidatus Helarchaeota archaeon]
MQSKREALGIKLSKWQVLYRNFIDSIWETEKITVRTIDIFGNEVIHPKIIESIAKEIDKLKKFENKYYERRSKKWNEYKKRKKESNNEKNAPQLSLNEDNILDLANFDQNLIDTIADELFNENTVVITPKQIDLIEINDSSRVLVQIYPLSFRCHYCGHFEIISPEKTRTLICPCCNKNCPNCGKLLREEDFFNKKCQRCNQNLEIKYLEQFSQIFVCPRCGKVHEYVPSSKIRYNTIQFNKPFKCLNEDCNGHLHFYITKSISDAHWVCSSNPKHIFQLRKNCECQIPKFGDSDNEYALSPMKATPASASSIFRPLIKSFIYLGDKLEDINIQNLYTHYENSRNIDTFHWKMSEKITDQVALEIINELYKIKDVFSIPKIKNTIVLYGYKSGIFKQNISEDEKLARFFTSKDRKNVRRYKAYLVNTQGRGLIFMFDKKKIFEFLKSINEIPNQNISSYDDLANENINSLNNTEIQILLNGERNLSLITLLHTLEHSLIKSVIDQIGLEIFGSKIIISDATIILYEREDIGSGGLVQITLGEESSEFKKFLRKYQKNINICSQMCDYACPACIYINDYYCQPYLNNEIERWIPPNSFLNRDLAKKFINF